MSQDVVDEYVDEVVEMRRRTVHVLEDRRATLSAWHGGERLCDLNTRTSVSAAVRAAGEAASHFGIGPDATLRLRVDEEVTRSWRAVRAGGREGDLASYEDRPARPSVVVLRRHAWDGCEGFLEPAWREVPFRIEAWIGLRGDEPPSQLLRASFCGVEVDAPHERWLYEGFGLGGASVPAIDLDEAEPHPGLRDRGGIARFVRARLSGSCRVSVPPGAPAERLAEFLGACRLRVCMDPATDEALGRYGRRPVFWTGEPGARHAWGGLPLPAPGDA